MEEGTLGTGVADQLAELCKKIAGSKDWTYACTDRTFVTIDNALQKAGELLKEKLALEVKLKELTAELATKAQAFGAQAADLAEVVRDVKSKEAQIFDYTKKLTEAEKNLEAALVAGGDKAAIQAQLDQVRQELEQIGKAKQSVDQEKKALEEQIQLLVNEIEQEKQIKTTETQNCKDLIAELNEKLAATTQVATKILDQ